MQWQKDHDALPSYPWRYSLSPSAPHATLSPSSLLPTPQMPQPRLTHIPPPPLLSATSPSIRRRCRQIHARATRIRLPLTPPDLLLLRSSLPLTSSMRDGGCHRRRWSRRGEGHRHCRTRRGGADGCLRPPCVQTAAATGARHRRLGLRPRPPGPRPPADIVVPRRWRLVRSRCRTSCLPSSPARRSASPRRTSWRRHRGGAGEPRPAHAAARGSGGGVYGGAREWGR